MEMVKNTGLFILAVVILLILYLFYYTCDRFIVFNLNIQQTIQGHKSNFY